MLDAAHGGVRPALERDVTVATSPQAVAWAGWGTAAKPAWEPICLARKPLIGTVAANVLRFGTGALNIDGCRVDSDEVTGWSGGKATGDLSNYRMGKPGDPRPVLGRWPANLIHDGSDEVLAAFPDAPGQAAAVRPDSGSGQKTGGILGKFATNSDCSPRGDSGSAARFFYSAKADATDRLGSKHPTVKPVDLMRWLVRLVTPPGGRVLDPFAGTGTTGVAALAEGFHATLIEREEEYLADIRRRIAHVQGADTPLFAPPPPPPVRDLFSTDTDE